MEVTLSLQTEEVTFTGIHGTTQDIRLRQGLFMRKNLDAKQAKLIQLTSQMERSGRLFEILKLRRMKFPYSLKESTPQDPWLR